MSFLSSPELLVLHAARIKGRVDADAIARRYSLVREEVEELLLDHEARGFVHRVEFADIHGWFITESGRDEIHGLLQVEVEEAGARPVVAETHTAFLPLNKRFMDEITRWQVRPMPWDRMAMNDHTDGRWDEKVLVALTSLARRLRPLEEQLSARLARFGGYADRIDAALARVDRGEKRWVDEPGIDSCHMVWFELHEDLLATLGIDREAEV
ncbi:MAG TPA: transcriptional regulator [Actinomycetota bacterium]|nr:transcriptional regulator [Actinomycetota bacterium]